MVFVFARIWSSLLIIKSVLHFYVNRKFCFCKRIVQAESLVAFTLNIGHEEMYLLCLSHVWPMKINGVLFPFQRENPPNLMLHIVALFTFLLWSLILMVWLWFSLFFKKICLLLASAAPCIPLQTAYLSSAQRLKQFLWP